MFKNFTFFFDLDETTPAEEDEKLRKFITSNHGTITGIFKGCSHVLVSSHNSAQNSQKCKQAKSKKIPIIEKAFIEKCIESNDLVDINKYIIHINQEVVEEIFEITSEEAVEEARTLDDILKQDFVDNKEKNAIENGKVVIDESENESNILNKFSNLSLPSFRDSSGNEKNSWEEDKEFSVPLYKLFREENSTQFELLELQVQEVDDRKKQFRVWRQYGDDIWSKDVSSFKSEFGITESGIIAEKLFYEWSNELGKDKNEISMTKFPHIGSKYLLTWPGRLKDDGVVLNDDVKRLVNLFWDEALGEVSRQLENDVYSYTMEDVLRAEAILMQLKGACHDENKEEIKTLNKEFYKIIKHKEEEEINHIRTIARKVDLCQVIRDVLSVSEATFWGTKETIEAKYNAIGCTIQRVTNEKDFDMLAEDIRKANDTDHEIKVVNIYEINRPSEKVLGSTKTGPFFHASAPQNFIGILSRGLLLPKIVVQDHGGKRRDPGMLGDGIYFASSPETCVQYSNRSKRSGVRYMLMLQLDLGRNKEYYKFAQDLEGPPDRYDSTHGVKRTKEKYSDFKDHEYCIYELSRQQMTHLVEFYDPGNMDDPCPPPLTITAPPLPNIEIDEGFHEEKMAELLINDIENVPDPASRILTGLQTKGQVKIPLKAVHIRGKLLDLVSEIVILQVYKNESDVPIEAKYVFPLDGMAAVCGFEAFINGKHVVGKVQEKQLARKQFKEAVARGHGAYLMEEQEELPDLFNITVGNLPPHSEVLIKITYVAELQFEGELISFVLPGNVAPWAKDVALNEKLQDTVERVNVTDDASREFSLELSIEMPYQIRELSSPTHTIIVKKKDTKAFVSLDKTTVLENSGFHLLIDLAEIHVPRMFNQVHPNNPNKQACMLTFFPEFEISCKQPLDITFLLDVSNSMEDCKELLKKLVFLTYKMLPDQAIVKIISFGQGHQIFLSKLGHIFKKSNVKDEEIKDYLKSVQFSKGSTSLWKPLQEIYHLSSAYQTKNVFLFSDGYISDEVTTMHRIKKEKIRMFTFGVSPTANKHCLRKMANLGSGSFEYFDKSYKSRWAKKVRSQIEKSQEPLITDISVQWLQNSEGKEKILQAPSEVSTIFNGTRLVVYGFVPNCNKGMLKASVNGKEIITEVKTKNLSTTESLALHRIAAKAIINDWEEGILHHDDTKHESLKQERKADIIKLSVEHNIVTPFTSFIAIEEREEGEAKDLTATIIDHLIEMEHINILQDVSEERIMKTVTEDNIVRDGGKEDDFEDIRTEMILLRDDVDEGDEVDDDNAVIETIETIEDNTEEVEKRIFKEKGIIQKIMVLPDGARKEVEEEVPLEDVSDEDVPLVRRIYSSEEIDDLGSLGSAKPKPKKFAWSRQDSDVPVRDGGSSNDAAVDIISYDEDLDEDEESVVIEEVVVTPTKKKFSESTTVQRKTISYNRQAAATHVTYKDEIELIPAKKVGGYAEVEDDLSYVPLGGGIPTAKESKDYLLQDSTFERLETISYSHADTTVAYREEEKLIPVAQPEREIRFADDIEPTSLIRAAGDIELKDELSSYTLDSSTMPMRRTLETATLVTEMKTLTTVEPVYRPGAATLAKEIKTVTSVRSADNQEVHYCSTPADIPYVESEETILPTPYVGIHHEEEDKTTIWRRERMRHEGINVFFQAMKTACSLEESKICKMVTDNENIHQFLDYQQTKHRDGCWTLIDTVDFDVSELLTEVWSELGAFQGKYDSKSISDTENFLMTVIMMILYKSFNNIDIGVKWSNSILQEKLKNEDFLLKSPDYLWHAIEYIVNKKDLCSIEIQDNYTSYDDLVIDIWRKCSKGLNI